MKHYIKILFLTGIIFTVFSCEKENDHNIIYWELSLNEDKTIIENVIDDIVYKFCLLNESGEPANIFNIGENFSFYFSVTNKRQEKLYFYPGFAYSKENNFCKIYNTNNEDLGRPFYLINVLDIGVAAYPLNSEETCVFQESWTDNRISTWSWKYGTYESIHKEPLLKGNYYTEFKYLFQYIRDNGKPSINTDTICFKINFTIQ